MTAGVGMLLALWVLYSVPLIVGSIPRRHGNNRPMSADAGVVKLPKGHRPTDRSAGRVVSGRISNAATGTPNHRATVSTSSNDHGVRPR